MNLSEENIKTLFHLSECEMMGDLSINMNTSIKEIWKCGKVLVFILLKNVVFNFREAYFRYGILWNISSM